MSDQDDTRPSVFRPGAAHPMISYAMFLGVVVCLIGMHLKAPPLVFGGMVIVAAAATYDHFALRRGSMVLKVAMAAVIYGIGWWGLKNPAAVTHLFGQVAQHTSHYITPNWKAPRR